jgi:hypothetical protein
VSVSLAVLSREVQHFGQGHNVQVSNEEIRAFLLAQRAVGPLSGDFAAAQARLLWGPSEQRFGEAATRTAFNAVKEQRQHLPVLIEQQRASVANFEAQLRGGAIAHPGTIVALRNQLGALELFHSELQPVGPVGVASRATAAPVGALVGVAIVAGALLLLSRGRR